MNSPRASLVSNGTWLIIRPTRYRCPHFHIPKVLVWPDVQIPTLRREYAHASDPLSRNSIEIGAQLLWPSWTATLDNFIFLLISAMGIQSKLSMCKLAISVGWRCRVGVPFSSRRSLSKTHPAHTHVRNGCEKSPRKVHYGSLFIRVQNRLDTVSDICLLVFLRTYAERTFSARTCTWRAPIANHTSSLSGRASEASDCSP